MITFLEKCYCIIGLGFLSSAFVRASEKSDPLATDPKAFLMEAAVYGVLAVLCLVHWKTVFPTLLRSWPIALLLLFALSSACWSSDALVTIKRAAVVCATSLFGIYFGSRFEREEQIRLLALAIVLMALFSVVAAFAFPDIGLDSEMHAGAWQGIFPQKNMLGRMMVIGCCSLLCLSPATRTRRTLRLLGVLACGSLILLSRSRDAILIGLVLWICSLIALRLKNSVVLIYLFGALGAAAAAFILFPSGVENLLVAFGRDATLTGRTDIWRACIDAIREKPSFGYGFSAFWRGLYGPSFSVIAEADWIVPHAHNGCLQLMLDLGLVGFGLFALGLLEHVRRATRQFRTAPTRINWWPLLYMSFLLLYNVAESSILGANSIFWALYVSTVVAQYGSERSAVADRRRLFRIRLQHPAELPTSI